MIVWEALGNVGIADTMKFGVGLCYAEHLIINIFVKHYA